MDPVARHGAGVNCVSYPGNPALDQLDALEKAAKRQGIPYTRLVRQFIDEGMRSLRPSAR